MVALVLVRGRVEVLHALCQGADVDLPIDLEAAGRLRRLGPLAKPPAVRRVSRNESTGQ